MYCTTFCRSLSTNIFEDVKKHVPVEIRKKAYAWKCCGLLEFHIPPHDKCPEGFYRAYSGCCKWYARFQGWCDYLDHIGVEVEEKEENKWS